MKKFEKIYNTIKSQIDSQLLRNGDKIPYESELMEMYSVSRPTVSKALKMLQDEGVLVRQPGLGSFVTSNDDGMQRTLIFGIAFPEYSMGEIFEPITSNLRIFGKTGHYNLLWGLKRGSTEHFTAHEMTSLVDEYIAQKVDGVFFAPWERNNTTYEVNKQALERLKENNIPVVLIDRDFTRFPERSEYPLVCLDNFKAGYIMAKHFLDQSQKRIDFMWLPYDAFSINSRFRGCRMAMLDHGITPENNWIHFGDPEDRKFVNKILDSGARNIICGNDEVAAVLMNTLREVGIEIPKTVRIAGFDDVKYSRLISVPLTTIHQPVREIAKKAVEVMFSLQTGKVEYASYTTQIDCFLVERESSRIPALARE
jgi:GntR family transcriptional regulator, arabinose operon transcriptional repressor